MDAFDTHDEKADHDEDDDANDALDGDPDLIASEERPACSFALLRSALFHCSLCCSEVPDASKRQLDRPDAAGLNRWVSLPVHLLASR